MFIEEETIENTLYLRLDEDIQSPICLEQGFALVETLLKLHLSNETNFTQEDIKRMKLIERGYYDRDFNHFTSYIYHYEICDTEGIQAEVIFDKGTKSFTYVESKIKPNITYKPNPINRYVLYF